MTRGQIVEQKRKKKAVIAADRYRDGHLFREVFLSLHGGEYTAVVVAEAERMRGYLADLYILCHVTDHDLFDMVYDRAGRNGAPVHSSHQYTRDT